MGPLTRRALVPLAGLALAFASPVRADPLAPWRDYIAEASARFGIPVAWIERVMRAESGGRTTLNGRPITSRAGAMGLMQLMPGTWFDMRRALGLGSDPHAPRDNILAGTAYLRLMYDRFGYPGCFAAYNVGPARYTDHLATGRPLPPETIAYLAATSAGEEPSAVAGTSPARAPKRPVQGLFVVLRTVTAAPAAPPGDTPPSALFAPLRRAEPATSTAPGDAPES
ncbi:lytic transglycosylase domain-containing protein [Sphingomonas sp. DT-204]|uniref:lytic transglycosylase domain-containing protein n=1 Tax=Sphingomonas sp. DT-204 TaxID=3396166 RepID=UPI003F192E4F